MHCNVRTITALAIVREWSNPNTSTWSSSIDKTTLFLFQSHTATWTSTLATQGNNLLIYEKIVIKA